MKFILRIFFILTLSALFSISFAYSEFACCYQSNFDDIIVAFDGSCSSNQIFLGNVPTVAGAGACNDFQELRLGCVNPDGTCSEKTARGEYIFDIPEVLSATQADIFCPNRKTIDPTCTNTNAQVTIGSGGNGGGGSTGGPGGGGGNSNPDLNFTPIENPTNEGAEQVFCSDTGGPFGMFIDKVSCESANSDREICMFNPYLAGVLSNSFINDNAVKFNDLESACIPKSQIKSCLDYKTKASCESNLAIGTNPLLDFGCEWIASREYADGGFEKREGICISKAHENKHINPFEFAKRGNLIKNPSFEELGANWEIISGSTVGSDKYTYHGNFVLALLPSSDVSQKVYHISEGISYSPFLYARIFGEEARSIRLEIKSFDDSKNQIGNTWESSVNMNDFEREIFHRIDFNSYQSENGVSSIEVKISATGATVFVDAISFERATTQSASISSDIFSPISTVPAKASYCSSCYEKYNLNMCTKQKSSLLGDCSYMVQDKSQEYKIEAANLGSKENFYSLNSSWESQSLANANLFCELYINENQCKKNSNYVNSKFSKLHPNSGSTLCEWKAPYGCFKDSNGDDLPDTYRTNPILRGSKFPDGTKVQGDFNAYIYEKGNGFDVSDFALGCDILPPQSYMYFRGVDDLLNDILVTDTLEKVIGDVTFYVEANDAILESCKPFVENKKLFLEYEVNNQFGYLQISGNQMLQTINIKDFFLAEQIDLYDGINEFSFMFHDQSGNRGKEWNYTLEIDVNPPGISIDGITQDSYTLDYNLGPNPKFELIFDDYTQVKECSYELESFSQGVEESYYSSQGIIDFEPQSSVLIENWEVPIFESTSNPDAYQLTISCMDIYDQSSDMRLNFFVDFNTDLIVQTPRIFQSQYFDTGYLNSPETLVAISSEFDLDSCEIDFGTNQGFNKGQVRLIKEDSGFEVEGYEGVDFYHRIETLLDFSFDGLKTGTLSCIDPLANQVIEDLTYYYDTQEPTQLSYTINDSRDDSILTVIRVGDEYYTISRDLFSAVGDVEINFKVDGTLTPLSTNPSDVKLRFDSGGGNFNSITSFDVNVELIENSTIAKVLLKNFEVDQYIGLETGEEKLNLKSYEITFKDKAQNEGRSNFEYYFDSSNPDFIFSGDIALQEADKLYTSKTNPNFEITFNSPDYREFQCEVKINIAGQVFKRNDFVKSNKLSFVFSDIVNSFRLSDGTNANLELSCIDSYGIDLTKSYTIIQDTTPPVLNSIFLSGGETRYLRNIEFAVYEPIVDFLNFDLTNTNEEKTICEYRIVNLDANSFCNSQYQEEIFVGNAIKRTGQINILEGEPEFGDEICIRSQSFPFTQSLSIRQKKNLVNEFRIDAKCKDAVGHESEMHSTTLIVNYSNNMLVDFSFNYTPSGVIATIKSIIEFDGITLTQENSNFEFGTVSGPDFENGLFVYQSLPLDLSSLNEGLHSIKAQAISSGIELDSLYAELLVDNELPTLEYTIPQIRIENKIGNTTNETIYTSHFELSFIAQDNEEIRYVEIFIPGIPNPIYKSSDLESTSIAFVNNPQENENYFSNDFKSFNGKVILTNLNPQEINKYKVVTTDKSYNKIETTLEFFYEDGFMMFVDESSSVSLDNSGFGWVTRDTKPLLKLHSTQSFDSCILNMVPTSDQFFSASEIEFNLNNYPQIDITSLEEKRIDLFVSCIYDKDKIFRSSYPLRFVNSIPDYTIESEEGFILTDSPYTTKINLKSVGVYRRLNSCSYKLDGAQFINMDLINSENFETQLNFSSFPSGEYEMEVSCKDFFNQEGPIKKYDFIIDKETDIKISNIKLIGSINEYEEFQNSQEIYLSERDDLTLTFNLNRKGASCQYTVQNNGFISNVVNFVENLFNINYENIENTPNEIYSFQAKNLDFEENESSLVIACSKGSSSTTQEYQVIFDESQINIGISRINN